jgi:hypothetical protein
LKEKERKPRAEKSRGGTAKLKAPASAGKPVPASPLVFSHLAPAKVSEVYESYWRFAAERQAVFFRRAR